MQLRRLRTDYLSALALAAGIAAVVHLGSCNPYDLLVHDRFEQAGFNSDVDILWVIDSSNSMSEIQEQIRTNFEGFISAFANVDSEEGQELTYNNITDATVAFTEFLQNQERFLNYQMAVTTTDIENPGNGNQGNLRSLAGIGGTSCLTPEILTPESEDVLGDFTSLADVGVAGGGNETGLLAAAYALCKSMDSDFWDGLDSRPDTDPIKVICGNVPAEERACNEGFVRDGSATVIVVVSDEGDDTYRSGSLPPPQFITDCVLEHNDDPFFGECDCRLSWMLDFFDGMEQPVVFATIGPTYQDADTDVAWCDDSILNFPGPCNPFGSDVCGLDFYQQAACLSGGLFSPIQVTIEDNDPSTCTLSDFEESLRNIGALISNLARGWRLSTIPDEDSISVIVDGQVVPNLADSPSGGWRYLPQDRAIAFSGEALPSFNAQVDIFYYPLHDRRSQVGRDLPF